MKIAGAERYRAVQPGRGAYHTRPFVPPTPTEIAVAKLGEEAEAMYHMLRYAAKPLSAKELAELQSVRPCVVRVVMERLVRAGFARAVECDGVTPAAWAVKDLEVNT